MKVIFLDRDGVINAYPGDYKYVTQWEEFRFLPGAKIAMKKLNDAGHKIFVVSNQAGVTKGIFSESSLDEITQKMLKEIEDFGAHLDGIFYCLHRDEDNCSCRKPKTGLIEMAVKTLDETIQKNNKECFFVGDTARDIQTGKTAGCKTILVYSGKEKPQNKNNWTVQPDYAVNDLLAAVELILKI